MSIPVFICCRDRVTCLQHLVEWLEPATGVSVIYMLDNDSTYEPLLEYYASTPHEVLRLGRNLLGGSVAIAYDIMRQRHRGNDAFVFTDPDIIPESCVPPGAIEDMRRILTESPGYARVGLGLEISDLPEQYWYRGDVVRAEGRNWVVEARPGWYVADIDTTFHVERFGQTLPHGQRWPSVALRGTYPYVARHTAWYVNPEALPADEQWYVARAAFTHSSLRPPPQYAPQYARNGRADLERYAGPVSWWTRDEAERYRQLVTYCTHQWPQTERDAVLGGL